MAGTGGNGGQRGTTTGVNTWDKTITVTTGNSARGNAVTRTIPNPNYIEPKAKATASATKGDAEFQKLLAEGTIVPTYMQKQVQVGRGEPKNVDDYSRPSGFAQVLPDGKVKVWNTEGKYIKTSTPRSGGGGLFGDIGEALSNIGGGISDAVGFVGKDVSENNTLKLAITAAAAAAGVPPQVTAAILGANQTGQTGNLLSGLETAAASYLVGSNIPSVGSASGTAGATGAAEAATAAEAAGAAGTTAAGSTVPAATSSLGPLAPAGTGFGGAAAGVGLKAGGTIGMGASTVGTGLSSSIAANSLAPSLGLTGLMGGAAGAAGLVGATGAGTAGGILSGAGTANAAGGSMWETIAKSLGLSPELTSTLGSAGSFLKDSGLLSTGLNALAGQAQASAATDAAKTQSDAIVRAAQIAADAAKFKPVGVTTGFGSSKFGYDDKGNLTSAGYELSPEMKAQRDALIAQSGGLLDQFKGSQAATAGMGTAAERAMALGNQYLATDPQAQAQKYYADQMRLLEPTRASDMAALQAQMQAQGRGGFAIGGGVGGMGAANPQLQALFNAQLQQNNQLAANATQGGMDYAKFGAGMVGTGGNLLSDMYGTQSAAFNPYKTALGGAQTVEGLGQNALSMGIDLGKTSSTMSGTAGGLLASGMTQAANTMAPANAYSPWANLLGAGASAMNSYKFDPMTGKAL